jgi:hypothetical protein
MPPYVGLSSEYAEKIAPKVQAALEGKLSIPPQTPFAEAWVGMSLYYTESPSQLDEIIRIADGINHDYPKADQIAWAFLRFRTRGWLVVKSDTYGLTAKGRQEIGDVVGEGSVLQRVDRLKEWISANRTRGE